MAETFEEEIDYKECIESADAFLNSHNPFIYTDEMFSHLSSAEKLKQYMLLQSNFLDAMSLLKKETDKLKVLLRYHFVKSDLSNIITKTNEDNVIDAEVKEGRSTVEKPKKSQPVRHAGCIARQIEGLPVYKEEIRLSKEEFEEVQKMHPGCKIKEFKNSKILLHVIIIPEQVFVWEQDVSTYKVGNEFITPALPYDVFQKSLLSQSLATDMLYKKHELYLPFNRIALELNRRGYDINRQILSEWQINIANNIFKVIVERLTELLIESRHLQADETYTLVLKALDDGGSKQCRFWVFLTADFNDGHKIVIYQFELTRSTEVLRRFFGEDVEATLTSDGYVSYKVLGKERSGKIIITCCWFHASRKFKDILTAIPKFETLPESMKEKEPAYVMAKKIGSIFHEDKKYYDCTPQERLQGRQSTVKPLVEEVFSYAHNEYENMDDRNSTYGKALQYLLNQEDYLKVFLDDPYVPMHNESSERCMVPLSLTRNNSKIYGSPSGAEAEAIIRSVAVTAKHSGADVRKYLEFVFEEFAPILEKHQFDKNLEFVDPYLPWSEKFKEYEKNYTRNHIDMVKRCLQATLEKEDASKGEIMM